LRVRAKALFLKPVPMNELLSLHQKLDNLSADLKYIRQLLLRKDVTHFSDKPFTVTEAADFTGLSPSTIYKLVHYKKLQPLQRKKRGRLLFLKQTLFAFLQSQ
jgi:excisionase family DNA binding protein